MSPINNNNALVRKIDQIRLLLSSLSSLSVDYKYEEIRITNDNDTCVDNSSSSNNNNNNNNNNSNNNSGGGFPSSQEPQNEKQKQKMIPILQEAYQLYTSLLLSLMSKPQQSTSTSSSGSTAASAYVDDEYHAEMDLIVDHHYNGSALLNVETIFYLGKDIVTHLESLLEDIAYKYSFRDDAGADIDINADADADADSNNARGCSKYVATAPDQNDRSVQSMSSENGKDNDNVTAQQLLEYIANTYKEIVLLVDHHQMDNINFNCNNCSINNTNRKYYNNRDNNTATESKNGIKTDTRRKLLPLLSIETVEELYLDYAIASKRANNVQDCIDGHIRRMNLFSTWPYQNKNTVEYDENDDDHDSINCDDGSSFMVQLKYLRVLDAVRLLGVIPSSEATTVEQLLQSDSPVIEEICRDGIFQSILMINQNDVAFAFGRKEDGSGRDGQQDNNNDHNTSGSFSERDSDYESTPHPHQQQQVPKISSLEKWYPSKSAILIGQKIRRIFIQFNYSFENCHDMLSHLLLLKHGIPTSSTRKKKSLQKSSRCGENKKRRRFFSANSFFNHRRDLLSIPRVKRKNNPALSSADIYSSSNSSDIINEGLYNDLPGSNALKILTYLFLFGVALKRKHIEGVLSEEIIQTFVDARLLSPCYSNNSSRNSNKDTRNGISDDDDLFVAECQIYPLHTNCFEDQGDLKNSDHGDNKYDSVSDEMIYPLFFMTDWPLESMRLPRDAIMPVGYDTLELLSLSSGSRLFKNDENNKDHRECPTNRVLDLCCGCGIQGLFAAARDQKLMEGTKTPFKTRHELYCMDINERAKHFVTANMCLNDLSASSRRKIGSCSVEICFVHGDIYNPIPSQCSEHDIHSSRGLPISIGKFNHILSNPPFVAVPDVRGTTSLSPALYTAGGGVDGMDLLRRILIDCFRILNCQKATSPSTMLMVTELPNVENSCELILSMLHKSSADSSRIRVAYVESDVELMEEYAREREIEAGLQVTGRDWGVNWSSDRIRNRALVLISVSTSRGDASTELASFDQTVSNETDIEYFLDEADCEDVFLTKEGIAFSREFLL